MEKDVYKQQLDIIVNDTSKFHKLQKDPTEDLKKKLNGLIDMYNNSSQTNKFKKLIGHFQPGYIYGNPKIHKSRTNPPIRPIISQIGTPTYDIAKTINTILKPYCPSKYSINSTKEFIDIVHAINTPGLITSLDVESLFTNVPVIPTINIILQYAYHDPHVAPPSIPEHIMRELLTVCTTETPFKHINGDVYQQIDGVSMGSPLGPLFAEFYMSSIESKVLPSLPEERRPFTYCRYVDDIFVLVRDIGIVESLKSIFEAESVLTFTYEQEKNGRMPFLDVLVERGKRGVLNTSVYVKGTNSGACINYRSIAPERYKVGVVKTMLHRAYLTCSTWSALDTELRRLQQLFAYHNFPQELVEREIKSFLQKRCEGGTRGSDQSADVSLFFQGQMTNQYKQEEQNLHKIIDDHLAPTDDNARIKLHIYYNSKKLSNLFIKNNPHKSETQSRVVYRYTCPDAERCQPSQTYIGHTTCSLRQRMTLHAQNGSIKQHQSDSHSKKVTTAEILNNIKVIFRSQERQELYIAEALFIKEEQPTINNQKEGETRILHIF